MTPAARNEMAIGMKMTTLNAVAHLIFSASRANIRPSAHARVGALTTQMMLFFRALSVAGSVNSVP